METIDIKDIIHIGTEAVKDPGGEFMNKLRYGYKHFDLEKLRGSFYNSVWDAGVRSLGTSEDGASDPLLTERGIVSLIHKGVPKEKIGFSSTNFYVQLDRIGIYIVKKASGFVARLMGTPGYRAPLVKPDPEQFADFCLQFDARFPEIEREAEENVAFFKEKILERTKLEMTKRIQMRVIDSLIEQFIRPLGIEVHYHFNDKDGTVKAIFLREFKGEMTLPVEQFLEALRSVQPVLDSLKVTMTPTDDFDSTFDPPKKRIIRLNAGDLII